MARKKCLFSNGRLGFYGLILGCFVFSAKADELKPVTVQLKWNHQFQFAGFYAAKKKGFYRKNGLQVSIKSWRPGLDAQKDLVDGRVQFAVVYGSSIIDYAKGVPLKLLFPTFQYSPSVLISHEPVTDLKQLAGKTVMNSENLQIISLIRKAEEHSEQPIRMVPATGDLNSFISRKVDLYSGYFTNEPIRLKKQGVPFYIVDPKSFGIQSYGDFVVTSQQFAELNPGVVQKFKEATLQGWHYALNHKEEIVDYILANYPTVKGREDMLEEAEKTADYVKTGASQIGEVSAQRLLDTAIMAKNLGMMTEDELNNLDVNRFVFVDLGSRFTPREVKYLESHPVIKVANNIAWSPIEYIDNHQAYKGLVADYFALFEQRLGVKFEPVYDKTWPEVINMMKRGELDLFTSAVKTSEFSKQLFFTKPYLNFPMVFAGRKSLSYLDRYGQLDGKTVAVLKGYRSYEYLSERYPNVNLMMVDSVKQGLEAVHHGHAFVYLGNLAVINQTVQQNGWVDLHIVGQAPRPFELAIGVQRDNWVLFNIMRKALASVTEEEKQAMYNRWIHLELVKRTDDRLLIQVLTIAGGIILLLFILALIYRYQKGKQSYYIREIHELSLAVVIDARTLNILWVSQSFCNLTGYSQQELIGQSYLKTLAQHETRQDVIDSIQKQVLSGQVCQLEMEGRTKHGDTYCVDITFTPERNIFGRLVRILTTRVDITDKKRIEKISITDELTGLYNRRYYNEIIQREAGRAKRKASPLALVMMDVDFFKRINDTYGHQQGDEVLKQLASVIRNHFSRGDDFVFRMGGEEFMVVSSEFEDERSLLIYLEELRSLIESLRIENKDTVAGTVTLSMGAGVFFGQELNDLDKLYHLVDSRLYQAKETGRNKVVGHYLVQEKDDI